MLKNSLKLVLCLSLIHFNMACTKASSQSNTSEKKLSKKTKNLILVIGDGMGPQQISMLYSFAQFTKTGVMKPEDFIFKTIADKGQVAFSATNPDNYIVTDSACSATHLATGMKSLPSAIGVDSNGYSAETILEKAQKAGKSVGLVSDTRITHATPASFASHVGYRDEENEIAKQMLASNADVMLSAGLGYFLSKKDLSKYTKHNFKYKARRDDGLDLLAQAKKQNYDLAFNLEEMNASKGTKLLGLFGDKEMPDGIWYTNNKNKKDRSIPTLKEMALTAIKKLEQDEDGFFLMVEAGQIDWAGHRNDAGTLLHQMIEANEAITAIYEYVKDRDDTLMLVTADHETGSFGFAYNLDRPFEKLEKEPEGPHYKGGFKANLDYLGSEVVDKLYGQKLSLAGIVDIYKDKKDKSKKANLMQDLIKEYTGFNISKKQAKQIIKNTVHPHGHGLPKFDKFPAMNGQSAFYTSKFNTRTAMITRAIGPRQGVTWGTGGHTATPVGVFSFSNNGSHLNFGGFFHHSDLGRRMQEVMGL